MFFRSFTKGLVIGLVALSLGCQRAETKKEANPGTSNIFSVETYQVQPTLFRETLNATGSLRANESVSLQSERIGFVREILFEEGRPVKKGDLLIKIDDSELRAQLQRAEAKLAIDQITEQRQRDLLQRKGISQAEYDAVLANWNIAKAEVELIKAQLAKTEIRAPFDGIVGLRQISLGSYVTSGQSIVSLQDIDSLKLDFSLPERYLNFLRIGQAITFRITGRAEKFQGTVYAMEPMINMESRSIQVRALVPNPETRLLPGSFAEVEVMLDENKEALLIPAIALIPGLREQTVFIHNKGQVEVRKVEIGIRSTDKVQIVEGLSQGDEVITTGILQLRPGMKVQVKSRRNPQNTAPQNVEKT